MIDCINMYMHISCNIGLAYEKFLDEVGSGRPPMQRKPTNDAINRHLMTKLKNYLFIILLRIYILIYQFFWSN